MKKFPMHALSSSIACVILLSTTVAYTITQFTPTTSLSAECFLDEPQSFEELFAYANTLFAQEKYTEAALLYKQAVALSPDNYHAWFNLGTALYWAKQYPAALQAFEQTVVLKDDYVRAHLHMSKLLIDMKRLDDARVSVEKTISLDPTIIEPYLLSARLYNEKQKHPQAIDVLLQGLAIEPHNPALLFELANTYNASNHFEQALELYHQLSQRSPNNPALLYNIAYTLKKLGRIAEAMPYYDQTLALQPFHKEAHFSRGLAYLALGDFTQGWKGYEWRYNKPQQGSLRSYSQPRWDGSDLTGKRIYLHAEQGLGDTFQFIRYAQIVKEKGGYVIAGVQKPLVTLLAHCPYIDEVVTVNDTPPAFDLHAPIMSLPYILKTTIDTIPSQHPYLFAHKPLVTYWKNQLENDKNFKIGICWQGNDSYGTAFLQAVVAQKSIHLSQLAPLCTIPGVSVYSLQRMTGTEQLNELDQTINLITFDESFDRDHGRFMDTAALIANLDLVITIDTSICHLAAALGIPVWNMLPNPADWRWMLDRTDSPWYPHMRLFRQPTPGDWKTVIENVVRELELLVQERADGK